MPEYTKSFWTAFVAGACTNTMLTKEIPTKIKLGVAIFSGVCVLFIVSKK